MDYWPKVEFRKSRPAVIGYVVLFFAARGGMVGLASLAGGAWTVAAGVTFLLMGAQVFVQRAKTGL